MKYGTRKAAIKLAGAPAQNPDADKQERPLLGRVGQGLFGSGLALSNIRNAVTYANPNETLYHGTGLQNAANIIDGGGLDVRYAGYADRINSKMLANVGGRVLMDLGFKPTEEELAALTNRASQLMSQSRRGGLERFDSTQAVETAIRESLTARGVADADISKTLDSVRPTLQEAGKRIYLANTPAVAGLYAPEGNEGDIMGRVMRDPLGPLKSVGNAMTGGILPEIQQTYGSMAYDRAVKAGPGAQVATPADAQSLLKALQDGDDSAIEQELRRLSPNITDQQIRGIQSASQRGNLGTTIGARVNRTNMKSLSDFPMLTTLMSLNPGIKHEAARYLPSLDPTKDLSVPENIPTQDFRNIDIIDSSTGDPLFRFGFDQKNAPISMTERLHGLRKAAPFVALGALGGDLVQDAVRQKGTYLGKGLKKAKEKLFGVKTAGLKGSTIEALKEVGRAGKAMAIPLAGVAGTGLGGSYIVSKSSDALNKAISTPEMLRFQEQEKKKLIAQGKDPRLADNMAASAARQAVITTLAPAISIAGGSVAAATTHPLTLYRTATGKLPASGKGLLSLGLTGLTGAMLTPSMMMRAEQIRGGQDLSSMSPLYAPFAGSSIEKKIRDNPELGALVDLPTYAGVPLAGAYATKKHYSGHLAVAKKQINKGVEMAADAINRKGGLRLGEILKAFRQSSANEY